MQQYYIEQSLDNKLIIENEKFHYLKNVIRIKKGDKLLLFNTLSKGLYVVEEVNKRNIEVNKIKDLILREERNNIALAVGLLKKDNTELVIQKAVELGVKEINLVKFQNNVVKVDDKVEKKIKRYNDIAISACEQSKRNSLCNVNYINSIKNISFSEYDQVYLLYEQEEAINSLYKEIHNDNKDDRILLIVGPEGGFDNKEISYFKENNIKFVSLGDNILRAETAAIMSVGLTNAILNEKG